MADQRFLRLGSVPGQLHLDLECRTQRLVRAVAAASGVPIPAGMRPLERAGPLEGRDPVAAGAAPPAEAGADAVVISFAADVRPLAGSGQPVWDETAEMSVLVARMALASWARAGRVRSARVLRCLRRSPPAPP